MKFGHTTDGKPGYIEAGADTVTPFSNIEVYENVNGQLTYTPGGATIDITTLTDDYQNLTTDNLFVIPTKIAQGYCGNAATATLSMSYDPVTGILKNLLIGGKGSMQFTSVTLIIKRS